MREVQEFMFRKKCIPFSFQTDKIVSMVTTLQGIVSMETALYLNTGGGNSGVPRMSTWDVSFICHSTGEVAADVVITQMYYRWHLQMHKDHGKSTL